MVGCGLSCFVSDPSTAKSNQIDKDLAKEKMYYKRLVKLLLLGAGESGKSTFLKQMRIIRGEGFAEKDLLEFRPIIYQNMIKGMKVLVDARDKLGIPWGESSRQKQADFVMGFNRYTDADPEAFRACAPHIQELWLDSGIKQAYERRREFQLGESVSYFYEHLDRISEMEYIPSEKDMLLSRKATKGIQEYGFKFKNVPFRFFDVGGQRSQRQESLDIFEVIVNNSYLINVSIILFLNKYDLLIDKIQQGIKISDYFPEFLDTPHKGDPLDLQHVREFLLYKFESLRRDRRAPFFHHFTTAIDTENIRFVYNAVEDTILQDNLKKLMLE